MSQNEVGIQEWEGGARCRLNPRLTYLSGSEQQVSEVPAEPLREAGALVSLGGSQRGHGEPWIFLALVCLLSHLCFCLCSSDQHTYCLSGLELEFGPVITKTQLLACVQLTERGGWSSQLSAQLLPGLWTCREDPFGLLWPRAHIPPEFTTCLGNLFSAGITQMSTHELDPLNPDSKDRDSPHTCPRHPKACQTNVRTN